MDEWMDGRTDGWMDWLIDMIYYIIYQDLPTGHHLRLLSLQKPPEETCWKVLV